jgi:hypothetical protein
MTLKYYLVLRLNSYASQESFFLGKSKFCQLQRVYNNEYFVDDGRAETQQTRKHSKINENTLEIIK